MKEVSRLYRDWSKDYDEDSKSNTAIVTGQRLILPMLRPTSKDKILDVGCGTGRVTEMIAKKSKQVIGIDFSEGMLSVAREKTKNLKNVKFQKVDVTKVLPFKDNTFDKVTAILVLNHIKNDKRFLREIYRVLKKGGVLLLDDFATRFKKPFKPRKKNMIIQRASEKDKLIFGRGMTGLVNRFHEVGFEIEEIRFTNIDKNTEPFLTKKSYEVNKGRTLEAFYRCKKN